MRTFVEKYIAYVYSQNGEDGILAECLARMGIENGYAVEFGAFDGITNSNTRRLLENGWKGLMVEADSSLFEKLRENTKDLLDLKVFWTAVTPANVNDLVKDCDVLSIDVDGDDYKIWKAYQGSAKIVIIEINSMFRPDQLVTGRKGTSYRWMIELAKKKGYFPVCHVGNIIFIQQQYRDLFPELTADPITQAEQWFDYGWINGSK
jgi:hypothetical protein